VLFAGLSSGSPTNSAVLELYQPTANTPPVVSSILAGNPPIIYAYTGPANQFAYVSTGN
jgi:hypothetical protein